jgi:hypothetical protein
VVFWRTKPIGALFASEWNFGAPGAKWDGGADWGRAAAVAKFFLKFLGECKTFFSTNEATFLRFIYNSLCLVGIGMSNRF